MHQELQHWPAVLLFKSSTVNEDCGVPASLGNLEERSKHAQCVLEMGFCDGQAAQLSWREHKDLNKLSWIDVGDIDTSYADRWQAQPLCL